MDSFKRLLTAIGAVTILIFTGCGRVDPTEPVEPLLITAHFDSLGLRADGENWIGVQDQSLDFSHRVLKLEDVERKQAELDSVSVNLSNGTGELVISAGAGTIASQTKALTRVTLSGLPEDQTSVDVTVGMVLSQKKFLYLFLLDAESGKPLKIAI
ncbi:MAG: hypothetical protein P1U89_06650 [Verrucomicrobiales bacterium]|nr:hypothetical protein [Verrucomicrobiales bacterium]